MTRVVDMSGRHRSRGTEFLRVAWRLGTCMLLATQTPLALAHLFQNDTDIGVILHVDPGDEPVAGEPSTFLFEFADRREKFSLDRCDCRFRVLRQEKEIFSQTLRGDKSASAAVPFVFEQAGVYRAEVIGTLQTGAAPRPFRVTFDVRVTPNESATAPSEASTKTIYILTAAAIALLIALAVIMKKFRRRK